MGGAATGALKRRDQSWLRVVLSAGLLTGMGLTLLSTGSEAARWERDVVMVRDHTAGRRWGPIIEAQVGALNAALPRGAPRFVYRDAGKKDCDEIERTQQIISICSMKRLSRPAAASVTRRGETIHEALILLRQQDIRLGHHRVCHELMHAVTAIPDAYDTEPESCVRGELSTLGAWDVELLGGEYGRRQVGKMSRQSSANGQRPTANGQQPIADSR